MTPTVLSSALTRPYASGRSVPSARRVLGRLARALLSLLRRAAAPVLLLIGLYLLALRPTAPVFTALWLLTLLGLWGLLMARRFRLLRGTPGAETASESALRRLDLETGAALVLCTFTVVQALGGGRSPLHPLVYALTAFLCSLYPLRVALGLCGLILLCEVLLLHADGLLTTQPQRLALHSLFVVLFGTLHALFLKGQVLLQRRDHAMRVGGELRRMREEASDFRLLGTSSGGGALAERPRSRAEAESALAQGSTVVIRQTLTTLLGLLRRSLRLHSVALYWLDGGAETLRLTESLHEPGAPLRALVPAHSGVLGTVLKTGRRLSMSGPKAGHLAYYQAEPATAIGAFLGVPIIDLAGLTGVLCADRLGEQPFDAEEEALLSAAAEQILRILQSERAFAQVERARYEHERLYAASERLSGALTPEQVHETAFLAAREIVDFDFAAVTTYDAKLRRHAVVAARGEELARISLEGLTFADNPGLCAAALKTRSALPTAGAAVEKEPLVFDETARPKGMASLLILPLSCAGEPVGTLVLGGRRPGLWGKDQREMLGVLANQVAVSLENARMYQAMRAMATTDGLTGLTNRRAFQDRFGEMLQRAERQGTQITLLLTDIDHFKKINDTYGHPMGDAVLKRVAQVVQSCIRKIDMAARYGGEEFVLVLESTDKEGGRQLAERVRQEVQKLSFASDQGSFGCTLSLGMATFPENGRDQKIIVERADQALYHAKHSGRNRSFAFDDL